MSHPIEDTGFTIWHGDLDSQLKRIHGVTSKDLGIPRRALQDLYYGGRSVFAVFEQLSRQHLATPA
ncbi:hypothetical protein [Telmatospirillum sp. J64-1]|uniref:hypothetical protein n=1 Tax=Telmatospirillum sp. J64-1 TaxID=2502183 RepID=UPI00115C97C3|nr:hypothetical protein [Telmatospirillum sp. J64-1]